MKLPHCGCPGKYPVPPMGKNAANNSSMCSESTSLLGPGQQIVAFSYFAGDTFDVLKRHYFEGIAKNAEAVARFRTSATLNFRLILVWIFTVIIQARNKGKNRSSSNHDKTRSKCSSNKSSSSSSSSNRSNKESSSSNNNSVNSKTTEKVAAKATTITTSVIRSSSLVAVFVTISSPSSETEKFNRIKPPKKALSFRLPRPPLLPPPDLLCQPKHNLRRALPDLLLLPEARPLRRGEHPGAGKRPVKLKCFF